MLRSTAAAQLLSQETADTADVRALLGASDPVVAQSAVDHVREHPDASAARVLLARLDEADLPEELGVACVRALDVLYAAGTLDRPGRSATRGLARWLAHPTLRPESVRLAAIAGAPRTSPPHASRVLPDLAEALRIRSARVHTTEGELRIDLDAEDTPYTVWNFARLAEKGFYDGLAFHRVVPGFVAQGGDPRGDGSGGPGFAIPDELTARSYVAGTVGMALSGPDTGGSQWFVTLDDHPHLDGGYTAFGALTAGQRVAEAIGPETRILRIEIERGP